MYLKPTFIRSLYLFPLWLFAAIISGVIIALLKNIEINLQFIVQYIVSVSMSYFIAYALACNLKIWVKGNNLVTGFIESEGMNERTVDLYSPIEIAEGKFVCKLTQEGKIKITILKFLYNPKELERFLSLIRQLTKADC